MKCIFCGKKLDKIDCECKWCTFCGTTFDVTKIPQAESAEKKEA
ncbi:MAG: hypothetical protein PHS37_02035 [Candidatus Omnitrophica bacterium]|nr:hypothetical protein [Candidatus Omnitrophota bacterium]